MQINHMFVACMCRMGWVHAHVHACVRLCHRMLCMPAASRTKVYKPGSLIEVDWHNGTSIVNEDYADADALLHSLLHLAGKHPRSADVHAAQGGLKWWRLMTRQPDLLDVEFGQRVCGDYFHAEMNVLKPLSHDHPLRPVTRSLLVTSTHVTLRQSREANVARIAARTGVDAATVAHRHFYHSSSMREVRYVPEPAVALPRLQLVRDMCSVDTPDYLGKGGAIPFIKNGEKGKAKFVHAWDKFMEEFSMGRYSMDLTMLNHLEQKNGKIKQFIGTNEQEVRVCVRVCCLHSSQRALVRVHHCRRRNFNVCH